MSDQNSGEEQVVSTQVPVETSPSQPTGQGEKGPGPWQKDIESLGLSPEHQQIVDSYLREKWQPRVTELEQQYAPYGKAFQSVDDGEAAAQLLYQLRENPHATYEQLGQLIKDTYGEAAQDEPLPQEAQTTPEVPDDPRLQYVDQLMQEREMQAHMDEYNKMVEGYRKDAPELDEQWFAKLVVAANGDTEAALNDYKQLFPQHFEPKETPPPTGGTTPMAPQEQEEYDGDLEKLVRNVIRRGNAKN